MKYVLPICSPNTAINCIMINCCLNSKTGLLSYKYKSKVVICLNSVAHQGLTHFFVSLGNCIFSKLQNRSIRNSSSRWYEKKKENKKEEEAELRQGAEHSGHHGSNLQLFYSS